MVAFGFPPREPFDRQHDWLKNGFTFVSWPIPVEHESFTYRLVESNKNGNIKKRSLQPIFAMVLSEVMARLGLDNIIEDGTTNAFKRHSCVFSNVPGFSEPIYFNKSKVVKLEANYFNVIPQMLLMSYTDKIFVTLVCDTKRFPNAHIICDYMIHECKIQYENIQNGIKTKK